MGIKEPGSVDSWICINCGMKFSKKSNADDHFIRKHLPAQPSPCHVCHKIFRNPPALKRHRSKAHGITEIMMEAARKSAVFPVGSVPIESSFAHRPELRGTYG